MVPISFDAAACAGFLLASVLAACGGSAPRSTTSVDPEWRLVPAGTALGQRRQFFLYGRHLDSAAISAPPSVVVEKGEAKPGGRALPLYLTAHPASSPPAAGEAVGSREIRVKTADTSLIFQLKVVDETEFAR